MSNRIVLSLYTSILIALGVWFFWPIYEESYMFITIGVGLVAGFVLAWLQQSRKLGPAVTLGWFALAYVLLALPAANPRALANPGTLADSLLETIKAPVFAWKQLITIELPVGSYHTMLAPLFLAFMVTGFVFGWVWFGSLSRYWAIGYVLIGLIILAISFGATTVPGDFSLFGVTLPIPTPLFSGGLLLVVLIVFLNWGARITRQQKMVRNSSNIESSSKAARGRRLRTTLSGLLVIAVAMTATGAFMNVSGISSIRSVLRKDVVKLPNSAKQDSPLSSYRMYFNDENLLNGEILKYQFDGNPQRIRLATMPYYDGTSFKVASELGDEADQYFARVPSDLPSSNDGPQGKVTIKLGLLDSIWLPLVGGVRKVDFAGSNSAALADTLFVNRATATGVIIPGRSNQAEYTVTYNEGAQPDPTSLDPSTPTIDATRIPESLTTWLENQVDKTGETGQTIVDLANRLRSRGFLSHSFVAPKDVQGKENWASVLSNYGFYQSNAGHNMSRIDQMFIDINKQEAGRTDLTVSLVSTAGDDEQFATAIALIAAAKNFPSRVVIGFKTDEGETAPGSKACADGVCMGQNLTAWAEIKGANGQWLAIDATPQFAKKMKLPPVGEIYVPNPTEATDDKADTLPPAKATPSSDAYCQKHPDDPKCTKNTFWDDLLTWFNNYVVPVLQVLAVLGIFAAPAIFIVLVKRRRRKNWREFEDRRTNLEGAFEEYLDFLIDQGKPFPGNRTRLEIADFYEDERMRELAVLANLASFYNLPPEPEKVVAGWKLLEEAESDYKTGTSLFKRIRSRLSLRSYVRSSRPKEALSRIRSRFTFNSGQEKSQGSAFTGLVNEATKQVSALFSKRRKKH
jgi:hypothetical protein